MPSVKNRVKSLEMAGVFSNLCAKMVVDNSVLCRGILKTLFPFVVSLSNHTLA